jgi:hypothetical protein
MFQNSPAERAGRPSKPSSKPSSTIETSLSYKKPSAFVRRLVFGMS